MFESEFLEKHKNANVIVINADSHQVVAAEYTTDYRGLPRTFPVRFWIDGTAENMENYVPGK